MEREFKKGDLIAWDVGVINGWSVNLVTDVTDKYVANKEMLVILPRHLEDSHIGFREEKKFTYTIHLITDGEIITREEIIKKLFDYESKIFNPQANMRRRR